MALILHQLTDAAYLAAAVAAAIGLALPDRRLSRAAVGALLVGFGFHTAAFYALHTLDPTPSLSDLPMAVSLMAWAGTGFYLLLLLRVRGVGLVVLVAPLAFIGVFSASLALRGTTPSEPESSALWSHLHILLASAGLALLGVAGAAGALYVVHHRAIKGKRPGPLRVPLPSLEALDRVNALALALGFLLLTLGVLSGVAWVRVVEARFWPASVHANASAFAWCIYAAVVVARFGARQGARQSALGSATGFAILLLAVVGAGMLS